VIGVLGRHQHHRDAGGLEPLVQRLIGAGTVASSSPRKIRKGGPSGETYVTGLASLSASDSAYSRPTAGRILFAFFVYPL